MLLITFAKIAVLFHKNCKSLSNQPVTLTPIVDLNGTFTMALLPNTMVFQNNTEWERTLAQLCPGLSVVCRWVDVCLYKGSHLFHSTLKKNHLNFLNGNTCKHPQKQKTAPHLSIYLWHKC